MEHNDSHGRYRITPPRAFYEHQLTALEQEDRYLVDTMKPWGGEYEKGHYYVTEPLDSAFLSSIDREFHPTWKSCTECCRIKVKCGTDFAVIKRLPHNYESLMRFCERARELGVDMQYYGETAGVLCHKFVQNVMVKLRTHVGEDSRSPEGASRQQMWDL